MNGFLFQFIADDLGTLVKKKHGHVIVLRHTLCCLVN